MVDFRRVAILEPSLVFPRPLPTLSDKEIISHARQWAEVTLKNGADAWYFRFHGDYEFVPIIQAALSSFEGVKHLLPFPVRRTVRSEDAIHFRKSDEGRADMSLIQLHGPRGISCHTIADLRSADSRGFDYAFYSPIFPTKTHPEARVLGLEVFMNDCSEINIPVFALGGINAENEKDCLEAGAFGIAGIRMFME